MTHASGFRFGLFCPLTTFKIFSIQLCLNNVPLKFYKGQYTQFIFSQYAHFRRVKAA